MSDSTQLTDAYLLQSALRSEPAIDVSKVKSVAVIYDGNQGSYNSGLIDIDATSQLIGSRGFASLKDGYVTLPYVITPKSTGNATLNVANVIDGLSVKLNGKKIITESEYKGFWNNLRGATELSQDEVANHEADMHLYPDTWAGINFTGSAASTGDGYSNNQASPVAPLDGTTSQAQEPRAFNAGYFKRLQNTPPVVDATESTGAFSWASFGTTATKQVCQQNARGCFKESDATLFGNDKIVGRWVHILKIRLVDLHPIFAELDLLSNPQLKLRLHINAGTVALSGTASTMKLDSTTMTSERTVPIKFSSAAAAVKTASADVITLAQPMNDVLTTSGSQLSFSFGPLGNSFTTTAQIGEFVPYTTRALLSSPAPDGNHPEAHKMIRYNDCFAQMFTKAAGVTPASPAGQLNAAFDLQISGYKKNVKYVTLIPFAETSAAHFASAHGTPQFQSPFDSAPWTCVPGASIRNSQVQVGNDNVFPSSHEYDYESFQYEFSKLSSINGDLSSKVSYGLIDFVQWDMANRIMIADCSRITQKDVPQLIQVSGTNGSATGMNLLILVIYERELDIDRLTGEVHRTD